LTGRIAERMMVAMPSHQDDIEVLRVHLQKLQKAIARVLTTIDKTGQKQDTADVELPPDYVACREISEIIRKRSDSIARKFKAHGLPVIKRGRRFYVDSNVAGVFFPKWRRHLRKQ
jgi:hypothetical protein